MTALSDRRIKAIGPTNDQSDFCGLVLPAAPFFSQTCGGELLAFSSSQIRWQSLGNTASIRLFSAVQIWGRVLDDRGSVLTVLSVSLISGGKRLAYSSQAVCAQAGTF